MSRTHQANQTWVRPKGIGIAAMAVLLCIFSGIAFLCAPLWALENAPADKWGPHMEAEGKFGNKRNLGKLNVFLPITQGKDTMLFADVKAVGGIRDAASSWTAEGNFGLGFRKILRGDNSSNDFIWGVYGYFDYLRTENDNFFKQGTFGGELFTHNWDFRVNGYLPEDNSHLLDSSSESYIAVSGTSLTTNTTKWEAREEALPGFDVEVGYTFDITADHLLKFHAGYFRFDKAGSPIVEGPRGRVEYVMDNLFGTKRGSLTIGGEAQTDSVRDDQYFASVTLRVPLGKVKKSRQQVEKRVIDHRMTESIVRDVDIVSFAQDINAPPGSENAPDVISQTTQNAVNPLTNSACTKIIFASSTGTGIGTETDPANFTNAVALAGDNGLIVLQDSTNIGGNTITLRDGQTLMGAGTTLELKTANGVTVTKTFTGATPIITTTGNNTTAIETADGTTVTGLTLSGAQTGVYVNGDNNVALNNLTIDTTNPNGDTYGMMIANASSIALTNVNVTEASGREGFGMFVNRSSNITMTGGSIKGITSTVTNGAGAKVSDSTDVTFSGVEFDRIEGQNGNAHTFGIEVGGDSSVIVENCDITGITGPVGTGKKAGLYSSAANGSSITVNNTNFHDMSTADALYFFGLGGTTQNISGSGNSSDDVKSDIVNNGATLIGTITFD